MDASFHLHQPTLLFIVALAIGFSGALLILSRGRDAGSRCLGVWGLAMIIGALGLAVQGATRSAPRVAEGVGGGLVIAATACSWSAARIFAERQLRPALAAAGPALWLATIPFQNGSLDWAAFASCIGGSYTMAAAHEIAQTRAEPIPSRWPALTLLYAHGFLYLLRGLLAPVLTGSIPDWAVACFVGEGLLHTIGMAVLLPSMAKDRAERRSSEQLRALARTDGLTGVANRRHFELQLQSTLRQASRRGVPVALLMIDVDHFKAFNDTFGHLEGDNCLRHVATALAEQIRRPGDLVARYGGEEFAVILADTETGGALAVADSIRRAIHHLGLKHATKVGVVTVSIGAASIRPEGSTDAARTLVGLADQALYDAKSAGRDTIRCGPAPAAPGVNDAVPA